MMKPIIRIALATAIPLSCLYQPSGSELESIGDNATRTGSSLETDPTSPAGSTTQTTDAVTSEDSAMGPSEGCGNSVVDPGEDCDGEPSCTPACIFNICGDGFTGLLEGCDDGNKIDNDACTNNCAPATCGDAIVQPNEECDDGPVLNGAHNDCTLQCQKAACGDGLIHDNGTGTEECDDGELNGPGKPCLAACTSNVCGDADISPSEVCDDGNKAPGDGCSAQCKLESCGNGMLDPGESCDDGQNGDQDDGCTDDCTHPDCGDGYEQSGLGEACDLGPANNNSGACTLDCKDAKCGDGLLHDGIEKCDDGDEENNQAQYGKCDNTCQLNGPFCGDKKKNGPEQCDGGFIMDGICLNCVVQCNVDYHWNGSMCCYNPAIKGLQGSPDRILRTSECPNP